MNFLEHVFVCVSQGRISEMCRQRDTVRIQLRPTKTVNVQRLFPDEKASSGEIMNEEPWTVLTVSSRERICTTKLSSGEAAVTVGLRLVLTQLSLMSVKIKHV